MTIIRTALIAIFLLNSAPLIAATSAVVYLEQISSQATATAGIALLDTAIKEAEVIQQHTSLALQQPANLEWMKTHSRHVRHALDGRGTGPGLNVGLIRATTDIVDRVNLAAAATDAVPAIKTHSLHIATSAKNTLAIAVTMLRLTKQINSTTSVSIAASLSSQLNDFADILILGTDSNGDGKITWIKYEGGLMHCKKHLKLLRAAANL